MQTTVEIEKYILKTQYLSWNYVKNLQHKRFRKKYSWNCLIFDLIQSYQFCWDVFVYKTEQSGIFTKFWLANLSDRSRVQCPILKVFTAHRSDAILDKQVIKFCRENKCCRHTPWAFFPRFSVTMYPVGQPSSGPPGPGPVGPPSSNNVSLWKPWKAFCQLSNVVSRCFA